MTPAPVPLGIDSSMDMVRKAGAGPTTMWAVLLAESDEFDGESCPAGAWMVKLGE